MAVEREVKLDIDESFVLPRLDALGDHVRAVARGARRLHAVYWDTAELRLAALGYGLRHRSDGDEDVWTLKGETSMQGDAVVREELTVAAPPDAPPVPLLARLPAEVTADALRPVAELETVRQRVDLMRDGTRLAEVVRDTVTVRDGNRAVATFHEVEVEQVDPHGDTAVAAAVRELRGAGATDAAVRSKYARALIALGRLTPARRERLQ